MNQEVMSLFSPAVQPQAFDQIQISIASPEKRLTTTRSVVAARAAKPVQTRPRPTKRAKKTTRRHRR